MKNKFPIVFYSCWTGLGFIRGIESYNYSYCKYEKNKKYIYSNSIPYALFGIIIYANPAIFPFLMHKELYRLEVNLRNLENEKESSYYNNII